MQFPTPLAGLLALMILSHGVPADAEPSRHDSHSSVVKSKRVTPAARPESDQIGPEVTPPILRTSLAEETVEDAAPSGQDLSDWLAHYAPYRAGQGTDDAAAEGL